MVYVFVRTRPKARIRCQIPGAGDRRVSEPSDLGPENGALILCKSALNHQECS